MVFSLDLSTLSELVRPRMLRTLSMARESGRGERGKKEEEGGEEGEMEMEMGKGDGRRKREETDISQGL